MGIYSTDPVPLIGQLTSTVVILASCLTSSVLVLTSSLVTSVKSCLACTFNHAIAFYRTTNSLFLFMGVSRGLPSRSTSLLRPVTFPLILKICKEMLLLKSSKRDLCAILRQISDLALCIATDTLSEGLRHWDGLSRARDRQKTWLSPRDG